MDAEHVSSPEEIKKISCVREAVFRHSEADAIWREVSEEEDELRCDWMRAHGVTAGSPEGRKAFRAYVDRTDARMAWKFYDRLSPHIQALVRELYPVPPAAEFLPRSGTVLLEQRAV